MTKIDLPEALISDRDWKISQVQRHIAEKLKTQGAETLRYLYENSQKPDYIQKFLDPIFKEITVKEENEGEAKLLEEFSPTKTTPKKPSKQERDLDQDDLGITRSPILSV